MIIRLALFIVLCLAFRMACRAFLNFRKKSPAERVPIIIRPSRAEFKLICDAADKRGVSYEEYVMLAAITKAAGFAT